MGNASLLSAVVEGYCELAFDFVVPAETVSGMEREQLENTLKGLEDAGESTRGLYLPDELEVTLKAAGFNSVTHISPVDGQKQFFDNRRDILRLNTTVHMMFASRGKL